VVGFAGGESFDDAELEPVTCFDGQAGGLDGVQRAAQEVFAAVRHGDQWSGRGLGTNICEIGRSAVLVVTATRGEAHAAGESQTRSSAVMRIGQREVPKQDEPMTSVRVKRQSAVAWNTVGKPPAGSR